jgi:DNA-binding transcriptional ArsR family regulator
MADGPNIVKIAALIGDLARASMLTALMSGEALTATELAAEANVTKQTASAHLAKMVEAGLIAVARQGRHRYYRLAAPDVARLLEDLMGIAQRTGAIRLRPGRRDPQLRKARICYDHLAGDLGVAVHDRFEQLGFTRPDRAEGVDETGISLTPDGVRFCKETGIGLSRNRNSRRPLCRSCLDWSARRFHLAGVLGVGILDYCYRHRLARRIDGSRVVRFSAQGERRFRQVFLLE